MNEEAHKLTDKIGANSIFSMQENTKRKPNQPKRKKKKIKSPQIKEKKQSSRKYSSGSNYLHNIHSYGLKEISYHVKKIVKELGKTNYKHISDMIVNQIKEKDKKNSKDEKNIRRRIYDSLNVMKALNLFKNEKSKMIVWNHDSPDNDSTKEITHNKVQKQKNKLSEEEIDQEISEKKKNIEKLNNDILKLDAQKRVLIKFIERNKEQSEFRKGHNELDENEKIYFPFLLIEFDDKKENSISIVSNEDKSKLHIAFKEPFEIHGDLDSIMKLHLKSCGRYSSTNI